MDLVSMLNQSTMGGHEEEESPDPSATTTAVHTPISTPSPGDGSACTAMQRRTSGSESPKTNPCAKPRWSDEEFMIAQMSSEMVMRPSYEYTLDSSRPPLDGSFAHDESQAKAYRAANSLSQWHRPSDSKGSLSSNPGESSGSSPNHSRVSSMSTVAEQQHPAPAMSDRQDHSTHDRQSRLDMPTSIRHFGYYPQPLLDPPEYLHPDPLASGHRRANSAPDFPGIPSINLLGLPPLNHMQQPPSTLGQENQAMTSQEAPTSSEAANQALRARSSPPRSRSQSPDNFDLGGPMPPFDPDEVPTESTCMLVENCTTDSQHRKAISHIFGRNKLCTRQIPQPIWVHFCRKHYQRVRYRNVDDYAKLQIEMVLRQLDRLQAWSRKNKSEGRPGVVESWSLNTRKREQQRIASSGQPDEVGKKRARQEDEVPPEDDLDDNESPPTHWLEQQRKKGTTMPHAVPPWLLNKCRSGYTTAEVRAIMVELQQAILRRDLTQIPDIELLPTITTDPAEENKPAKYRRRNNTDHTNDLGPHKRSQSYDGFPQYGGSPFGRPLYPYWGNPYTAPTTSQSWGTGNPYNGAGLGYSVPPRTSERSGNPVLPLPAPVARRPGAQPVAQQLGQQMDDSVYKSQRSYFPAHQRTQSDFQSYRSGQQSPYDARSRYGTHYDTPRYQSHLPPWQDRPDEGSASGPQQVGSPIHLKTEPSHSSGASIYPPAPAYTTGSQYGTGHHSDQAASRMVLPQPIVYRASNATSGLSPSQAQGYGHRNGI